jgi:integrase
MRKRSSGEGTIVKRTDGRWAGAVSLPDGRRKWLYGKTQQEVVRKLAAVRHDRDSGLPISTGRRTVEDYLESW